MAAASFLIGAFVIIGYAAGAPIEYDGQTVPMALPTALAFVLLNASLLLTGPAIRRLGLGVSLNTPALNDAELQRYRNRLAGAAALLTTLIAILAIAYLRTEKSAARDAVLRELASVVELKATELSRWREERLSEGRYLQRTPHVATDVAALLAQRDDPKARARIVGWLEPIKGGDRYESAVLFDADGRLLLSVPERARPAVLPVQPARRFSAETKVTLDDLQRGTDSQAIHLELRVPILPPARTGVEGDVKPIANIVLQLNPARYLYSMLQHWPVPRETTETLLVRREGDELLYLSELRYQSNAALTLRRSIHAPALPAAVAALGGSQMKEGRDYRGVAVVAAMRPVPGSPWLMIAKIDQAEVYAPVRREVWQAALMATSLLLALAFGAAFAWRHRHALYLQHTLAIEQERAALAEQLALVMQHANDIILLMDADGRILEANERALGSYGYTTEELRTLPPGGLRGVGAAAGWTSDLRELFTLEGSRFETVHWRKDGTEFPVEVSIRAVEIGPRRLILGIYRDITERKQIEQVQEFLLRCGLPSTGEDFFVSLARFLAESLNMGYVCIDRLVGDGLTAQTVAIYNEGRFETNVSYALKDTPCGAVVGEGVCSFPRGVRELFPRDAALEDLKAESYFGITLPDSKGRKIGLIAIIGQQELSDAKGAETLLKLVAPRAAAELERRDGESALQSAAEALRARNTELERFNRASVGRELRMIELKREINALLAASGQPARFALNLGADAPARTDETKSFTPAPSAAHDHSGS